MGNDKKDLTGIIDLQKLQAEDPNAAAQNESQDPFAVNELAPVEQVSEFESIDQIGMMDHPVAEEPAPLEASPPIQEDPFAVNVGEPTEQPTEEPSSDPFAMNMDASPAESTPDPFATTPDPFSAAPESIEQPAPVAAPASPSLENIKSYSENTRTKTSIPVKVHYPFHLKLSGTFGPYERDKLLMFITENPIGLSSSDLDLQIQAGKVFLPRISEFAAVKLVQELRDSGLSFDLKPSDREGNETTSHSPALSYHYQNSETQSPAAKLSEIPILNANSSTSKPFHAIDEVSIVQYVRTEVIEVENSPMIQEVIERMTEALKQKARLKGGNALFSLKQEITPLRLPSQYQISLSASVVKFEAP